MSHSILRWFADGNPVIAFPKRTGTSLDDMHLCSTIPYPNLMFQLTQSMSIVAHTWCITIKHYVTSFFSRHHKHSILQAIDATSDKRSKAVWLPTPQFLFFFIFKKIIMRPSGTDLILWNTGVFIFPHRRVGILWCYADSMLLPPVDDLFVFDPPTCLMRTNMH